MPDSAPLLDLPQIEGTIDSDFQSVPPDTPLSTAIALLNHSRQQHCHVAATTEAVLGKTEVKPTSFLLIMDAGKLLGIFTERDIVKLSLTSLDWQSTTIATVMTHPVVTLNIALFKDIFAALFLFRRYHIRHLPIVEADGTVLGVVSPESIRQALQPVNLLKFRRVRDVMTQQVYHLPPTATVLDAAQMMAQKHVSCVVVVQMDEDERLHPMGIITERDIVQFQFLELNLATTLLQTVMSAPLFLLNPQDSLWTAHRQMMQRHVRRLVVSWNWGRNLGVVTQTNILRVFDPVEMYGMIETLQNESPVSSSPGLPLSGGAPTLTLPPEPALLEQLSATLQALLAQPGLSRCDQEQYLSIALQQVNALKQHYWTPEAEDEALSAAAIAWSEELESLPS